jgi:uncharacterized protein YcaQ
MAATPERLSVDMARRIALAAQGFADPRPTGAVQARQLRRVIGQLGALQIDPVNVLCRAHYLPIFARLGPYRRELLDSLVWGGRRRELFEYWAHKASILPLSTYPLMRWRMDATEHQRWGHELKDWRSAFDPALMLAPWAVLEGMTRIGREKPELVDQVLHIVAERGPLGTADIGIAADRRLVHGGIWNWNDAKIALEWLFYAGKVTTSTRRNFQRIYDLTERVVPPEVRAAAPPSRADAQRELLRIAARACGIATARVLQRYFHVPGAEFKERLEELVTAGEILPARVEDSKQPMYLWHQARTPRRVQARALLSPFDSLIWERDRTLQLFGLHYRIGIYTPAAKRTDGYYVLPFLLGDRLVARVDLKADRENSALTVQTANSEPGVADADIAGELAAELRLMAEWLALDRVVVQPRGNLAATLSREI